MESFSQTNLEQSNPHINPQQPKGISGWGDFFAIMMIINGVITCLGIITAVFGVPLIIAGVKLQNAVKASKELSGSNELKLDEVFDNLNSFFKIQGILIIVGWVIGVLAFITLLTIGVAAVMGMLGR